MAEPSRPWVRPGGTALLDGLQKRRDVENLLSNLSPHVFIYTNVHSPMRKNSLCCEARAERPRGQGLGGQAFETSVGAISKLARSERSMCVEATDHARDARRCRSRTGPETF